VFHFFVNEIVGMDTFLFLFIGLAVGWFAGKMLLERTPRVFRKKNLLRCGILLAVSGLTIVAALLDPFGIENWVPSADKVTSVSISDGSYRYPQNTVTMERKEDIAHIIAIHQAALEEHHQGYPHGYTFETAYKELITADSVYVSTDMEYIPLDMEHYSHFTISYQLTNGRTVKRYYRIWLGDEHGEYLRSVFSTPEAIFGYDEDLSRFLSENTRLSVRDTWEGNETVIRSQANLTGLYDAILADCRLGTMAQAWTFHHQDDSFYWIYLENGREILVFSSCENTLNWLRAYGLNVDEMLENHGK
jgi:hypothetical protein